MITELEALKTLLREKWDPIGLMPHLPPDEYDGFAFEIWTKLRAVRPWMKSPPI